MYNTADNDGADDNDDNNHHYYNSPTYNPCFTVRGHLLGLSQPFHKSLC
jgi:hypothetical protein